MTIVTCVKVRDGLVLGTDSMTHLQRGGQFLRSYQHARKLFQIGSLPMAVMTYGLGNIGPRSIESLIREFGGTLKGQTSVNGVAEALFAFMKEHYDPYASELPEGAETPDLGFYLAGYSKSGVFAEEREFLLPRDEGPLKVRADEAFGAAWRGVEAPFFRLSKGYGQFVRLRLEKTGMDDDEVQALLGDLEIDTMFDGMPVQDAVDYAVFVLKTTIGYATFSTAVSPCGGPLQIVAIRPDIGFKWLLEPEVRVNSF
jgi:hypothetical protein